MENALKTKKELAQELEKARQSPTELERRKGERRESEEKYRQIFENVNVVIIRMNKYGKITDVNSKAEQYFGFKREELIGKHFTRLGVFTLKELPRMIKLFKDAISGKVSTYQAEMEVLDRQGNKIFIDVNSTTVKKGDKTDSTVSIIHDITARRKAEEALKESEEKFSRIFSYSPMGLSLTRLRDGIIIEINDSYTTFTGYKREEIIGRKVSELKIWANIEDRDRMMKILKDKGRVRNVEFDFRMKSGEVHPVLVSAETLNIGGENCLLVMAIDISDRKLAEDELRESEEFTSSLLENTPNPIIVITPDTAIKYVNPAFEKLTGFTLTEVIGSKTPYPWWPQETKEKIGAALKQAKFDDGTKTEMLYQKKSGERFRVELNATSIKKNGAGKYTLVNWVDITERRKAEEALRMSEQKYAGLVEHGNDGILIIQDHVIKYLNSKLLDIFGYSYEEVIGKQFASVISEESRESVIARSRKRLAGEEVPEKYEFDIINKKGERVNLEVNASLMEFEGRPADMAIVRDITERKKAEEALKESEEKFSKAFNSSANAVCITTLPDNRFIEVNESYFRFTGYTREEVIGRTAVDLKLWVHDKELDRLQTILKKEGKFNNIEFHSRMKSGEIRIGLGSAEVINIGGRPHRIVVITDITERKKIENALQESEEKFFKAFNSSANAVCIVSLSDDKFLEVNESYCHFTGYSREEVIGHITAELKLWVYQEDLKRLKSSIEKEGKFTNFEFHSRMKSGEIRIGLSSAEVMSIAGEPCRIIVITDITERKKAKEALKESEEKFSKAFSSSANAIGITSMKDSLFVEVNDSFMRFTGYSREEIIGHSTSELNLWVKPEELQRWMDSLRKEGNVFNQEFSSRMKSGEIRIGLASAEVINIGGEPCRIVVITDITKRKRAEEGLRESEEKYRTLFESAAEGILIADIETKKFKYANPAICTMLGYSREELTKMDVFDIHPKTSLEYVLTDFAAQARGEKILTSGLPCLKKDGTIIYADIKASKAIIDGIECDVGFFTDITERKKTEEKLKQGMADLEQSSAWLAAANKELEAFSYSVSHDLRSPLRSIDGFSQALLEDYDGKLDATAQDYLKRLRNDSQKMGELIDGILRLSRLSRSELHIERVDLGALALEIATRLRETYPERQAEFIIGKDLSADGDPQLLRAVLENLLGNAWKFTSKVPRAIIEFGSVQSGAQKTFFVKDNGAGFDMSYVDSLFGAFQRLHDVTDFPGTGIGLATEQRIVNRHGGTVRAEGEVGKGATFYFTLG